LNLQEKTSKAVAQYWKTRKTQKDKQKKTGKADQGLRSAVTGGAQMDGFINLFTELITETGIPEKCIFRNKNIELPGFFRPTKEWDLLVVKDGKLVTAIEAKSQVGPSFGNNFNNRTEEAIGCALDLWTAYREKAYLDSPQPFLGYFFILEDSAKSSSPVKVKESHFKVFPEFIDASYCRRYEILCRKLVLERHYTSAAFITSSEKEGIKGTFSTPSNDLSIERFAKTLVAHVAASV